MADQTYGNCAIQTNDNIKNEIKKDAFYTKYFDLKLL